MHDLASGIFKCRRPPQWGHEHIHLFPLRWTRPAVFHTASLSHPAGLLTWAHFQPDAFPTLVGPVADVRRIPLTALGTSRNCTAFPILPPGYAERAPVESIVYSVQPENTIAGGWLLMRRAKKQPPRWLTTALFCAV